MESSTDEYPIEEKDPPKAPPLSLADFAKLQGWDRPPASATIAHERVRKIARVFAEILRVLPDENSAREHPQNHRCLNQHDISVTTSGSGLTITVPDFNKALQQSDAENPQPIIADPVQAMNNREAGCARETVDHRAICLAIGTMLQQFIRPLVYLPGRDSGTAERSELLDRSVAEQFEIIIKSMTSCSQSDRLPSFASVRKKLLAIANRFPMNGTKNKVTTVDEDFLYSICSGLVAILVIFLNEGDLTFRVIYAIMWGTILGIPLTVVAALFAALFGAVIVNNNKDQD
ncbi:MAG: hypothetical protein SGJ20_02995 [Planctomycetota bacterium]|nr:hypothetical protein [Planctomycetota bacterium]